MNVNPAVLLAGLVVVLLITVGAVLAIFLAGGPMDAQLARAGIITAITGSVIASLVTLLLAGRGEARTNANTETLNGHTDQLEAAEARIAYLENLANGHPAQGAEQSHG